MNTYKTLATNLFKTFYHVIMKKLVEIMTINGKNLAVFLLEFIQETLSLT